MSLHIYDIIIINSSAGKDSLVAMSHVYQMAIAQDFPLSKIIVSHQDLGKMEWPGTKELAKKQAYHFGFDIVFSKRRDKNGKEETLLEYAIRHGKWPSRNQRWCTSDFKRGPGARVVTNLTRGFGKCKVLYVFGFRKSESPYRAKKQVISLNQRLSTKTRKVYDWLPIHDLTDSEVWEHIRVNKLPYHPAYDMGMPRLSCCFCIFSPMDALVIAGKANPELLDRYIDAERKMGHTFRDGFSLESVRDAIKAGYEPKQVANWVM